MKKKFITLASCVFISLAFCKPAHSSPQQNAIQFPEGFARGADISWVPEMEDDGIKFCNDNGEETDLFRLMKDCGMNAVRLRVWVNPENQYGNYCNKADVLKKAKRAFELGMDIMIDFHYSDIFTDPGRQLKPSAWKDCATSAEIELKIKEHTQEILAELKKAGISPKWIQLGNEINAGMLWDDDASLSAGTWDSNGTYTNGYSFKKNFSNLASYINAGYEVSKSIFPDASVIIHLADGFNTEAFKWIFDELKKLGTNYDIIGLSHYPQNNTSKSWKEMNDAAVSTIKTVAKRYGKKVIVCEVGTKISDENLAAKVMSDFMTKIVSINSCAGIFYWEPQVYNWKPSYYRTVGWSAYGMGAFTSKRSPAKVLKVFNGTTF
ncbi:MAG: glycosyl hydrolase 53 family protein [Treponema sp.]